MAGYASERPAVPVGETAGPSTFTFESSRRNAHSHGGRDCGRLENDSNPTCQSSPGRARTDSDMGGHPPAMRQSVRMA
jgi:hypothetical protein